MRRLCIGSASAALLTSACAGYLPNQPHFNASILLPKSHAVAKDGTIDTTKVVVAPTHDGKADTPVPMSCETADGAAAGSADRDRCIRDLESDIDVAFHEYDLQLQSDIGKTNTLLDVGGLALSTASTAAGGAAAKTILSAIGTGIGGVRTSISEDYLYKSTMQTLHSQMIADRAKIATRIDNAMKAGVDAYDMHAAYRDLIDYYYAGTLLGALQSVNADAGAKATQCTAAAQGAKATTEGAAATVSPNAGSAASEAKACDVVTYTYNYGEGGAALQKIWQPDGKTYDKANETKLRSCMTKLQIAGNVTSLVNGSPHSDKFQVLGCYYGGS